MESRTLAMPQGIIGCFKNIYYSFVGQKWGLIIMKTQNFKFCYHIKSWKIHQIISLFLKFWQYQELFGKLMINGLIGFSKFVFFIGFSKFVFFIGFNKLFHQKCVLTNYH